MASSVSIVIKQSGAQAATKEIKEIGDQAEKTHGPLGKLGSVLGDVGKIAGGFVVAQGLMKLPGLIGGSINAASDLNESLSKMQTVFGSSAGEIEKWSNTTAAGMGISKQAALEVTGTFGNLFTAMGMGQKPAADMSMNLVQLSGDLASFNNLDPTEVLEKLRAGLVGEAEPLRSLGVNMNAAVVEAKAMEMGLEKVGGKFTDASLITARYAIIMDQTKTAQGDFGRTAAGAANRTRILNAQMADLSATIGAKLLPAKIALLDVLATKLLPALSKGIDYFGLFYDKVVALAGAGWERISGPLAAIAGLAWEGIQAGVEALGKLAGIAWGSISGPIDTMVDSLKSFIGDVKWLVENRGGLMDIVAGDNTPTFWQKLAVAMADVTIKGKDTNWSKALSDGFHRVKDAVRPAVDILRPFVDRLLVDLRKHFSEVGKALGPLFEALARLSPVIEPLAKALGVVLVASIAANLLILDLFVKALTVLIVGAITIATGAINGLIDVFGAVKDAVLTAKDGVVVAWEAIGDSVRAAVDTIRGIISGVADAITASVGAVQGAWQAVLGAFEAAGSAVKGFFETNWKTITALILLPVLIALQPFIQAWNALEDEIKAVWNWVTGFFSSTWSKLTGLIVGAVSAATSGVKSAWDGITGVFNSAWSAISGWFASTWSTVKDKLTGPITGAVDALANIGADFLAIGGKIIAGLTSGIAAAASSITEAIWDAKDTAIRGLGNAADWLVGIGWDVMRGFAKGIYEGAESAVKTALDWVTSMLPKWKGPPEVDALLLVPTGKLIIGGLAKGMQDEAQATLPGLLGGLTNWIADWGKKTTSLVGASTSGAFAGVTPRNINDPGVPDYVKGWTPPPAGAWSGEVTPGTVAADWTAMIAAGVTPGSDAARRYLAPHRTITTYDAKGDPHYDPNAFNNLGQQNGVLVQIMGDVYARDEAEARAATGDIGYGVGARLRAMGVA